MRARTVAIGGLLALPMAGLVLLLAVPEFDVTWEHHPSHFWLVLGAMAFFAGAMLVFARLRRWI